MDPEEAYWVAEKVVIGELASEYRTQAFKRTVAEIQFRLTGFAPSGNAESDLTIAFAKHTSNIDVASIYDENLRFFKNIVDSRYLAALRHFNRKGLFKQIAGALKLAAALYVTLAKTLLQKNPELACSMKKYVLS